MPTSFFTIVLAAILSIGALLGNALPAHAIPVSPMHLAAIPVISSFFSGQRPTNLGVKEGQLSPCPGSPNCVVSQGNEDAEHAIDPIQYSGDRAAAMARLAELVKAMPRTAIIQQTDDYLYAEFTSKLMGYVDDVEFYLDPTEPKIQVRSASRLGQSDLGVNRQRVEAIRQEFSAIAAG